ncbi:MAG: hypothetical protein ABWK53_02995 [Anaerolineales bacterium]
MSRRLDLRLWMARLLIAVVLAWNLECAFAFLRQPQAYAPAFELSGVPGAAAVRGVAILFLMWNVPGAVALWQPRRHRLSLGEALVMQAIGLLGESLLLAQLPAAHLVLRASILRFIVFDAAGLFLLAAAFLLARPHSPSEDSCPASASTATTATPN